MAEPPAHLLRRARNRDGQHVLVKMREDGSGDHLRVTADDDEPLEGENLVSTRVC